jgi:hypothetical protein
VDRTTTTDGAVDVADLPSTSGAHWANRDEDMLHRRTGRPATFRRPPAVNSFPDDEGDGSLSPSAYLPPATDEAPEATDMTQTTDTQWFGGEPDQPMTGTGYAEPDDSGEWAAAQAGEPEFGPAPPATPGRASFGMSAGPISPSGRMAVAPTSPAHNRAEPPVHNRAEPPAHSRAEPPAHNRAELTAPADPWATGGHEIRPHRAARHDQPSHDQAQHNQAQHSQTQHHAPEHGQSRPAQNGTKPRRSRTVMVAAIGLAVLVLLGGAAAGMMFYAGSAQSKDGDRTITAPLDGRTAASFELVAATTKVNVKTQDLGDDLYKITSADDTLPTAVVSDDRVQLHLTADGVNADGQIEVVLSTKVKWALRFVGGAEQQVVDLTAGKVSGLEVLGASRRLQLALPKPAGTVPISVTGAVEDFSITSPKDSPVRVKVDSGAKTVAAGDRTLQNVEAGSTLTPKDWNVPNRYDVDAAARVTLLSVDAR